MEKLWNSNYLKIWTAEFLVNFAIHLIIPLLPLYLSETFGATKDTIGVVLAGYVVMAIVVRPFTGSIIDSYPRRTVLLVCSFFFFLFFAGYLVAGSLTLFAIFRTIHGLPYGAATVAASTVAIDVLPSSRRTEGIGYFGLGKNFAMALGPMVAIYVLGAFHDDYKLLFAMALAVSGLGLVLDAAIRFPKKDYTPQAKLISLDRFFLLKGWREAVSLAFLSFSYGVISTYVAIYGKEELGITTGTGLFFSLFAAGLIVSRLTGARALRNNRISRNAAMGVLTSLLGYFIFAAFHNPFGYYATAFIIGLGNGHMYPAFQNMFINLAGHNQRGTASSSILTTWDLGAGAGMLAGGVLAESTGYHSAFWCAFAVNAAGILHYFLVSRRHYERSKLR